MNAFIFSNKLFSIMKFSIIYVIVFTQILFSLSQSVSDITPDELKCEYLHNPLAVDSLHPRLSWILIANPQKQNLTQKAYQILVATNEKKLAENVGDLWDTKKVLSDRNTHIKYNGTKLGSGQRAYWKVRVWDQNDQASQYSPIGLWGKGLDLNDWTAQWIGAPAGTQQKALQNLSDIDAKVNLNSLKGKYFHCI